MCLVKSISSKLILPLLVVLLSLFSCSKGGEPIPTANSDNSSSSSNSMVTEQSPNQTARFSNDVVGGDDNEDDDDNKETDVVISRGN